MHVTLSRDTQASLAAAVGTAVKSAGAVLVTAANDGAITASVPSTLVGTAHVTVEQDDAIAEVSGATFLRRVARGVGLDCRGVHRDRQGRPQQGVRPHDRDRSRTLR